MSYCWALEILMTDVFEQILNKKDIRMICREQVVETDWLKVVSEQCNWCW